MHLILLIVALSLLQFLPAALGQDFLVTRHGDGDIFTINGSCTEACTILSSGTASPYPKSTGNFGQLSISNSSCICQCNRALPVFREDLHICVDDINGGWTNDNCDFCKAGSVNAPGRCFPRSICVNSISLACIFFCSMYIW